MGNSSDYSRFGPELRRVRAGERTDERGEKKVWHQAGPDVEIISFVNPDGRVTRQECHVGTAVAVWQHDKASIVTGAVTRGVRGGSEAILPDIEASRAVVLMALSLLRAAPRGDRYLDHLRAELEAGLDGMPDEGEHTVTSTGHQAIKKQAPPPKPSNATAWIVGAIVAGVVIVIGVAIFLAR